MFPAVPRTSSPNSKELHRERIHRSDESKSTKEESWMLPPSTTCGSRRSPTNSTSPRPRPHSPPPPTSTDRLLDAFLHLADTHGSFKEVVVELKPRRRAPRLRSQFAAQGRQELGCRSPGTDAPTAAAPSATGDARERRLSATGQVIGGEEDE
jgi:hypothetical protein